MMLKSFCLIFRGLGQLADGTYLRISLYVLMIHFKKFAAFVRSVPISELSNRTKCGCKKDIKQGVYIRREIRSVPNSSGATVINS